jgi:hypothetical protein
VTGTAALEGIVLRYGFFHGPGAQTATPAEPGIYNVTDDGDPVASNALARQHLGWTPTYRRGKAD